jgi:hypothetical protein
MLLFVAAQWDLAVVICSMRRMWRALTMWGRLFVLIALVGGFECIQRWSRRRAEQRREKQGDISRWDDEGGAPLEHEPPLARDA